MFTLVTLCKCICISVFVSLVLINVFSLHSSLSYLFDQSHRFAGSSFFLDLPLMCVHVHSAQNHSNHRSLSPAHTIDWSIEMRNKIDLNESSVINCFFVCLDYSLSLSRFVIQHLFRKCCLFSFCPIQSVKLKLKFVVCTHTLLTQQQQNIVDSKSN